MPFRNTFGDKTKCLVHAAQTRKAISQRRAELDDTKGSDASTTDTHLQTKAIYCLVIFSRDKSDPLSSCWRLVMYTKFSHFLCVCTEMIVAMEETHTDRVIRDRSLFVSVFHPESWSLFLTLHPTEVAVMFKCREALLLEILLALHLALSFCSVWSQACTILCWIFSSEESPI